MKPQTGRLCCGRCGKMICPNNSRCEPTNTITQTRTRNTHEKRITATNLHQNNGPAPASRLISPLARGSVSRYESNAKPWFLEPKYKENRILHSRGYANAC